MLVNEPNLCVIGVGWPCLTSGEWAAWVQALGSLVGIGIAVMIPVLLHRATNRRIEEDKKNRARSFALALLPDVEDYAAIVRRAKQRLSLEKYYLELDEISDSLAIPPALAGHLVDIHELGSAGHQLQDALASVPRLRLLINDHEFYLRYDGIYIEADGTETSFDEPAPITPLMEKVDLQFKSAVAALRGMFEH
jgi:hypothetical protein